MQCDVLTLDNKKAGSIDLDDSVFGVDVKPDVLARVVNWQLAKRRSGNHKTKGISEIAGSTAKPWRQKGTGRARQGSKRATQWRGGQTVFGPVVRSHEYRLNKKVRRLGLRTALSSKKADGTLVVLDEIKLQSSRTKLLSEKLKGLGISKALVISGGVVDPSFARAAANLPNVSYLPQQGANVYDILKCETLILTKDAVTLLVERLK
ncbi:MAG: 50S ribosomal protein L4 [Pseudomonadota bacterium]|nr:50S ribosomal protein L4 [Pseudomonadota bacterium]